MPEHDVRRARETWMSTLARWLPPVCWAALILSLSTLPEAVFGTPQTSQGYRIHYYLEVVVHVGQFGIFFLLMLRALQSEHRSSAAIRAIALCAVVLLSLTNESLQTLTPTRMFDLADMA